MSALAEKLDEAADLIAKGWCQNRLWDGETCYCLYGAINKVVTGEAREAGFGDHRTAPLEMAIGAVIGAHPSLLADWNDSPDRSQGHVVAAFRIAAAKARGETA